MTKELIYQLSLEINSAKEDILVLCNAIMQQASEKSGFKIEFERHGFHKGSVFYFLRKEFQ